MNKSEEQQKFLALPTTRTMGLSAKEYAVQWPTQTGIIDTDMNANLVMHWHNVHNYELSDQSVLRAIQELRDLLETVPTDSSAAAEHVDRHGFKWGTEYKPDNTYQMVHRTPSHAGQTHARNEQIAKDANKELANATASLKADAKKIDFRNAVAEVDKHLVGRANGLVSHGDTVREKIQRYQSLKNDSRFQEPEFQKEIQRRIEVENSHLRF